jgi:hypothetical protein
VGNAHRAIFTKKQQITEKNMKIAALLKISVKDLIHGIEI